ncbi:MAG: hypothetical protein IKW10_02170 [Oscillospiraceae bacterium]|nr:hypothetical protein [Oscillospiraceae bacterium]
MKRCVSFIMTVALILGMFPMVVFQAHGAESTVAVPSATEEKISELFLARSEGQHPRILANSDDFARVRSLIQTDSYMRVWYERIYNYCVSQLDADVSVYTGANGDSILDASRTASYRITWMAFLYQISGERRFAERAVEEMLAVCGFPTWNPGHYLDVAQMAYGVGIGYDWLYHYMTDAQRTTISQTLYNYAIKTSQVSRSYMNSLTNWNPWCHAGVSIAACAIYEDYPQDCSEYLSDAVTRVQKALAVLTPSGAYPEGPEYYLLGAGFMTVLFATLDSVLGTDFGLSDMDGVQQCVQYMLAMNGNVSSFNFGDANASLFSGAMLHWFAGRYNMPELSLYQRQMQTTTVLYDEFLALLWYDPELVADTDAYEQQLDYLLYSDHYQSIASFRSEAGTGTEIYAAIKSGYNSTSHADMDVGTFVLDAMGERWFEDLGKENYALTGTFTSKGYLEDCDRWDCYRKRAEGQNTLVINPGEGGGQAADAKCQIVDYESAKDGGYAVVDMLDAYDSYGAASAKRGMLLFDQRSRVLVRDEITCTSAAEIYWFAHTKAAITLSADGKTAELTIGDKTLLAQIAEPSDAVFTVMDAQPLATSPNPSGQKSRTEYKKLAIHLENVTNANIAVVFTPVLTDGDRAKALPEVAVDGFDGLLSKYDKTQTLTKNSQGVYEISNAEQLMLFAQMVNAGTTFEGKTVKLMGNIDLKGRTFTPIGGCGTGTTFRGVFDGGNHTIKNLFIFEPNSKNVGFFGQTYLATVKNVGIESGTVFSGGVSGGLMGFANQVTLDNCFNRADVVSFGGTNGGLVGQLSGTSSITNCYNHASVRSNGSMAGGIVGYLASKTTLTMKSCYHTGNLSDTLGRCGLIGFYNTTEQDLLVTKVTVSNCYATTPIKSEAVTDNTALESYSSNAKHSIVARMKGAAISLGTSFVYDCEMENEGFPVLAWQCQTTIPEDLTIDTVAQLRMLAYEVNSGKNTYKGKTVKLGCNLDLQMQEWIPIGGNSTSDTNKGKVFQGTFDGQGHCIRNLSITANRSYVGLFGSVQGTIQNLGIESGRVTGAKKVAGLAGYCDGTIKNCYNRAYIRGNSQTGGLIGVPDAVHLENCYNTGTIRADLIAGGLIGWFSASASGSAIVNCYNAGSVTGSSAGGLAATLSASATGISFQNCYGLTDVPLVLSTAGYTLTNCQSLGQTELQTADTLLGTAYMQDAVLQQNRGFPVLAAPLYGAVQTLPQDDSGAYCIDSAQALRSFAYMVNVEHNTFAGKTVRLCADIDLEGVEWIPIGGNIVSDEQQNPYFAGTFDGGGHTVKNLTVTGGNSYVGLFGFVSGGTIRNVGIESGIVIGTEKAGAIAGVIRSGAVISGCYNKAVISGRTAIGGIVGMISQKGCTVENCYNTGGVFAANSSGGIAGYMASDGQNAVIKNCYNNSEHSCGIIGRVNASVTTAEITNCYTVDSVTLSDEPNSLVITDSYQLSPADLRNSAAGLGSKFAEDYFVHNGMFPVLAWENTGKATTLTVTDGVYQITCADDLRLMSYLVRKGDTFSGKKIQLQGNIDLAGAPWLSIGGADETKSYTFKGQFDGCGYTIGNLTVCDRNGFTGLFGQVSGATIQNVGVESGLILGNEKVGGIVGSVGSSTTVSGCYNKATVYGNNIVGGIAGRVAGSNCTIENCYNVAYISGKNYGNSTGGMIGNLTSAAKNIAIRNCYNVGHSYGVLSIAHASATGSMDNCYAVGGIKPVKTANNLVVSNTALVSADAMKGYASVLGDGFDGDVNAVNGGFPVLAWQTGKTCSHQYVTTPTDDTYHTTQCTRCGDTIVEKHAPWSFAVNPDDPSTHKRTCKTCGYYHYPSHLKYLTYTDNLDGTHAVYCKHCKYDEDIVHSYGEYEIIQQPTLTAAGIRQKTCVCGNVVSEEIPILVTKATVNGTPYETVQEAVDAAGGGVVKLMADSDEAITARGDLYLDLNGCSLSKVTVSGTLYGMDSATDNYKTSGAKIETVVGLYASNCRNSDAKRYLAIKEAGGVSFHRFYMGITTVSLAPAVTGFGYKAEFYGDEMMQAQVASIGYKLWVTEDRVVSRTASFQNLLTLRLKNFDVANHGKTPVNACVVVTLVDGTVIESDPVSYSMRNVLELVNNSFSSFATAQKQAVQAMCRKFETAMSAWKIANILAWEN